MTPPERDTGRSFPWRKKTSTSTASPHRRWSRRPRSSRMALGILTSSAVLAAAAYGIAVAVGSAHPTSGPAAQGATASSLGHATGPASLPGPFAWLASTAPADHLGAPHPARRPRFALPAPSPVSVPFPAIPERPRSQFWARDGTYLGYLNVTPRQGDERLADLRAAFRLAHLRGDETISATQDGSVQSVQTANTMRSCVTDDYVTEVGHHHFHEVACLVMTTSAASVVVAATSSGDPAHLWAQVERAVAAYPFV